MHYLNTLGLQNFRLFKDETKFELAPITILTGTNSSGKSSLIKALLLLRSSIKETGSIEKLSFSGGRHNLGWFGQTLNSDSEKTDMVFTFNFPFEAFPKKTLIDITYFGESKKSLFGKLKKVKIYLESGESLIEIEAKVQKNKIEKNHEPTSSFNRIFNKSKSNLEYCVKSDIRTFLQSIHANFGEFWASSDFKKKYKDQNHKIAYSNFTDFLNKNHQLYENTDANIFREFYFRFFDNSYKYMEDRKNIEFWETKNPLDLVFEHYSGTNLNEVNDLIDKVKNEGIKLDDFDPNNGFINYISIGIENIFELLNINFPYFFMDVSENDNYQIRKTAWKKTPFGSYVFEEVFNKGIFKGINNLKKSLIEIESLASFRANTERIYTSNSDVVEINNLIWEFSQSDPDKWKRVKEFIVASLKIFNIGDDIQIKSYQGVVSEIFIMKGQKEILLADLGYGFSQLIPIVLKVGLIGINKFKEDYLSSRLRPTLFLLEEPEANLHPSLQSKLADFIILAATEFNIQFIIETHSEYMIRNFQYLTAKKELNPWDTQIFYFNHPDSKDFLTDPVKEIDILSDGRLSDEFGEGFFDEIPKLLAFLYNSSSN